VLAKPLWQTHYTILLIQPKVVSSMDLREFKINTLRRRLAVVSQDTFIFNTSAGEFAMPWKGR